MDILGIDIGTVSVKYVRCKSTAGNSIVSSQGDYPYKGDFEDLRLIVEDIRMKEGADCEVAVGISSPDILKKTFTIPVLPKKEQKDALNWTAAKVLSISLDDMVYEHLMLGRVEEKNIMKDEFLFVGAQKGYIDRVRSTFERAGFQELVVITDIAFAYIYALGEIGERSVAVIDIGGKRTGLYIASGRRLMFAREILTASESFSDALMSGPGLSFDEAEQVKKERGFDKELTEILKIPFERLAGEIHRTFSVYNQHYPDKAVTQVYLTGRGARIPKFFEKLKETLVEEVDRLDSLHGVEDKYIPAQTLCMHMDVVPNLLPEGAKRRAASKLVRKFAMLGTAAIVAVLVLVSLGMWRSSQNIDLRLVAEQRTLDNVKKGMAALGFSTTDAIDPSDITFIRSEIQKKDVTFITLLKYLSSRTPKDVYLRSIEFGGEFPLEVSMLPPEAKKAQGQQPPEPPVKPVAAPAQKIPDDGYPVALKGYVLGEPDALELSLFNFILALKDSTFIRQIDIVNKETKTLRGKQILEFALTARCAKHEL
ncbi:MAG: pilus assembly protein PilM [Syntrophorhabdaceae bacterium]|nr:pilus assembly protein PilM [Syntrophorhabdaceae bacterium]MDD4194880.1 pilus assembly protein PilM [Syntrophorhabdaceae bacterium]